MQVTTVGLDLAKNIFHVHGVTQTGEVAFNRPLRRAQVLAFFERLSPCLIGIEACASSHHWGRELTKLGHTVRLMPPMYVKPYVKRGKSDAVDAEPIEFPPIPICPYPQFMGRKRGLTCEDYSETSCRKMHEIGLDRQGVPLPPSKRPRCGAKTRASGSCRWPVVAGKRRCRFHGGASTGPKTTAGRAQVAEAQRKRWSRDPC